MKYFLIIAALMVCFIVNKSNAELVQQEKYIEVIGTAEMEVQPDEIRLIIGVQEYWKEEFEKSKDYKDYKTKVSLGEIETNLFNDLMKIGITKDKIIVKDVGNYWRNIGKDFLFGKQYEIILTDFKKLDEITREVQTRGIDNMRIGELKNKKLTDYRKQVKIEALKAAKDKADYLLQSIGKKAGDVISIEELEGNEGGWWGPRNLTSNAIMSTPDNSNTDNFRNIKLRYEVKARFEIR
ncbi:MAG: SIMPL domain-containing protein [Ignavibacteriae bacterium]|nr:SIMPL domain-containing protein [Ignavibacteriota bacterium]